MRAEEAFRRMSSTRRETIDQMLHDWLWEFATATATAHTHEGRVMPTLPREIADELGKGALEAIFNVDPEDRT